MPVKFRGVSEYASTYQWTPSYRSTQFKPTQQQTMPEAGLRSDQMTMLVEPNFTKKRQVPHRKPEANQCLVWFHDDGSFASSDSPKPEENEVLKKTYVVKAKKSSSKTRANIDVDVAKTGTNVALENKQVKSLNESFSTWEKTNLDKVRIDIERKKREEELQVLAKQKKSTTKPLTFAVKKPSPKPSPTKAQKHKNNRTVLSSPSKEQKLTPKKEVKKTPKKEAKTVPLRYRPLHYRMHTAHQSEYQQMFRKPAKFVPSSPLINALDVVHASSSAIPPHNRSPKMRAKSEYASNFKNQSPLSKSLPAFTSPASPSMKLKVKNLPTSPAPPRCSPRKLLSEYTNQFPEQKFPVMDHEKVLDQAEHNKMNRDGTGFDREHINQLVSPKNKLWDLSSVTSSHDPSADKDNQGSMISTEQKHVRASAQFLESKLKRSNAGTSEAADISDSVRSNVGSDHNADEIESIATVERDSLGAPSVASSESIAIGIKPVARKLAWDENDEEDGTDAVSESETLVSTEQSSTTGNNFEGRLPTPQLKEIGGGLRTHHDLTTPCSGGALLTSPTSSKRKIVVKPTPVNSPQTPSRSKMNTRDESIKNRKSAADEKSKTSPSSKVSKSVEIPRRMQHTFHAPIRGSLRDQEFQPWSRNSRPVIAFDQLSLASSRSIASAEQLLEKSRERKDFWAK
ncbi:nuclear protein MDM1-like [Clavelina lepadiformis]|uniref:nuclear protein MDM1-like n=1 Tax=Clavelina lepadiformis TaxID=159417 RepID=UPI004041943A